jgi:hypothetical protein
MARKLVLGLQGVVEIIVDFFVMELQSAAIQLNKKALQDTFMSDVKLLYKIDLKL